MITRRDFTKSAAVSAITVPFLRIADEPSPVTDPEACVLMGDHLSRKECGWIPEGVILFRDDEGRYMRKDEPLRDIYEKHAPKWEDLRDFATGWPRHYAEAEWKKRSFLKDEPDYELVSVPDGTRGHRLLRMPKRGDWRIVSEVRSDITKSMIVRLSSVEFGGFREFVEVFRSREDGFYRVSFYQREFLVYSSICGMVVG